MRRGYSNGGKQVEELKPPRPQIAEKIADLRARAVRYSLNDPRRLLLDEEADALVDDWLKADG